MKTVFIIAGGTGGHIFPSIAIGEQLSAIGIKPIFIVRRNIKDIQLVTQHGFQSLSIPASGFVGKNLIARLIFIVNFLKAMILYPLLLKRHKPQAIIASGSFTSLVPVLWAIFGNRIFFLLEQNCIPGRFTKYFAHWAKEVYIGLPLKTKIKGNLIYTGNPLRSSIINALNKKDIAPKNKILVLGGSQGANFLTVNVIELAARMPQLNFIIQTGEKMLATAQKLVKTNNCELIGFTPSPEELYLKAKVVISRAGGMVLSEILFFGIPSILIPFPFATDNHQRANAQFLAQNNAAIVIDQNRQQGISEKFISQLQHNLQCLLANENQLNTMSKNAKAISKANAASVIAERIFRYLK
ncbi:MAG: UDP-N-acetylglucosamine--N-acetylmuramyl-(pentapeptide) pyrophosphoryl-undecaprenol N-acetylglucosamine transferase [candidate division WOR-3 bacterium]